MTSIDVARDFPSLFDHQVDRFAPAARVEVPALVATPEPATFASLGIPAPLVRALRQTDIIVPFPIQAATIPDALAGRDVLGRGQTGSGKTLAFGLPVLTLIAASGRSASRRPKALVLVPTRELAMQVNDVLTPLAKSLGLFTKTAFGGAPYHTQIHALDRGVDVLVATPGRLGDLIERGACSLSAVEVTVLDEADQMADLGFLPDVTALLDQTPGTGQRLLFSATLDSDVDALVKRFLTDPVVHELQPAVATVDTMDHHALLIPPTGKFDILAAIANRRGRTIMFVKTQLAVDRLVDQLADVGVRAGALHGGKTQRVRTRTLAEFREGRVDTLIATNVAARGIHVDGVSLVVHVDPPNDAKDYLHRAGRTARAGEQGTVVTLVLPRQRRSTFTMLERAGVTAARTPVTAAAPELAEVTGARKPSGVPVPPTPPPAPARRHSAPAGRRLRFEHRRPRVDEGRPRFDDRRPRFDDRRTRSEDKRTERHTRFEDRRPRH
jgi:superfamily II DNA/RNA helicase